MKKLIIQISNTMEKAFEEAGYDAKYGKVTLSNRPDLCEFQCNGSMAAAKAYKKAPIQIANEVLEKVDASDFEQIEAVMPGFINIKYFYDICLVRAFAFQKFANLNCHFSKLGNCIF